MKLRRLLLPALMVAAALLASGCMSRQERAALLDGPYTLQVDYAATVEDWLRAGRYDWSNHRLTSANFPAQKTGTRTLSAVLVAFSPQASLDYVLGGQAASGRRPADLKELLAFGASYPDVQRRLPVLALGSSADLVVATYTRENDAGSMAFPFIVVERKVKRLYPFLAGGFPGRVAGLEWLDDPAGYGMYYALFVTPP